jgi:hypothetical protein
VHYGQDLASLADEAEPLGPLGDEGGRRRVHCFEPESLPEAGVFEASLFGFADEPSGASGSDAAGLRSAVAG